jgi:hypothetical protein
VADRQLPLRYERLAALSDALHVHSSTVTPLTTLSSQGGLEAFAAPDPQSLSTLLNRERKDLTKLRVRYWHSSHCNVPLSVLADHLLLVAVELLRRDGHFHHSVAGHDTCKVLHVAWCVSRGNSICGSRSGLLCLRCRWNACNGQYMY